MWRQTSRSLQQVASDLKVRVERRVLKALLVVTVKMAKRALTARLARRALRAQVVRAVRLERRARKALQDRME